MADYFALKQQALRKYFGKMNPPQQQAVFTVNGPILILAGAGSGKTTVLVNRIANMLRFGNSFNNSQTPPKDEQYIEYLESYVNGKNNDTSLLDKAVCDGTRIKPWQVLAITFTNKAAGELRERLTAMLGEEEASQITAATFHSACVRILRREIEHIGYDSSFTIYDSDDSQRLVKTCLTELNISDKQFPPRSILSAIGAAKDELITPQALMAEAGSDYRKQMIARIYELYQSKLIFANALDFDDIIKLTVELFEKSPDVLQHYQNRYKYICVDEYQDTNHAQYKLVSMLSDRYKNLCVVGDDDQSIYKFRGATIENILSFEEQFVGCTTIRLEQNYRSTQNILSSANAVISNNPSRKPKSLWTNAGDGELVTIVKSQDEQSEAKFISETILEGIKGGKQYQEYAVLYRVNAQSNTIERAFVASGIPYRVMGGLRFYDRKEIKDVTAYLSFINNHNDMLRLKRIINEPKRGIGDATVAALENLSYELKVPPTELMATAAMYPIISKKASSLTALAETFHMLEEQSHKMELDDFLDLVLESTGYLAYMTSLGNEGISRIENINELKTTIADYQQRAEEPTLSGFLEEISLYTDVDRYEGPTDCVLMMTMHSAKGLEFPVVFVAGMEDGMFPSIRSMDSQADMEEERRLAYVAITRAKHKLFLTHASCRMIFGQTTRNMPSRFIKELDSNFIESIDTTVRLTTGKDDPAKARAKVGTDLRKILDDKKIADLKLSAASHSRVNTNKAHNFAVGDKISHNIFGEGTIISVRPMAGDAMIEVEFDKVGTKKLMANFAKIIKI